MWFFLLLTPVFLFAVMFIGLVWTHRPDSKVKGISKKTLRTLEQIAMAADYGLEMRGGIEGRNNDSEDFPEVSINAIQAMLEKAYLLGKADGMKKAQ